jgi:predicted kinase
MAPVSCSGESGGCSSRAIIVLLGGPAGTGKPTVGAAWCRNRPRAALVELDSVRDFIVGGRTDLQIICAAQVEQYETTLRACAALTRSFYAEGYDVVIDDVFYPDAFRRWWMPLLDGLPWHLVVLRAWLEETLQRGSHRQACDRAPRAPSPRSHCAVASEQRDRQHGLDCGRDSDPS